MRALLLLAATLLPSWTATAAPPAFGVRWTARIPVAGNPDPSSNDVRGGGPIVVGGEVHVLRGEVLATYDLASGAARTRKVPGWRNILSAGGHLVALTEDALLGVDPATLAPTWHVPSRARVAFALGELVADDPGPDHRLVARRAGDGQVAWETVVDDTVSGVRSDGGFIYVRTRGVLALDAATGRRLWSAPGDLLSAAGGRTAILISSPPATQIRAGADGHVVAALADRRAWVAPGYQVEASRTTLAATADDAPAPRWQRTQGGFVAGLDDAWIYAIPDLEHLVALDAATGQPALTLPLEGLDYESLTPVAPARRPGDPRAVVVIAKRWLVAIGELPAPAQPRPATVTGRLIRPHCTHGQPDDRPPLPLAKVRLDVAGVPAVTDAQGRFTVALPATTGAPVPVRYHVGGMYSAAFPRVLVPDGQPVEYTAFFEYRCP